MTTPISAYPDQEQAVMDILSVNGPVSSWLPGTWKPPMQHVQRIGGGPDEWDVTDYGMIRVHFYGVTRAAAMTLAATGEGLILAHRGRSIERPGRSSDGMLVDYAMMDIGGMVDPDLNPDDKRVTKNFTIGMRRQLMLV